ncbi:hypothetical protein HOY80DRAFT_620778 [Tuber brumale]|nr:hypothetical protein HOY80DRAFT_620778 [Tuber brumale]
MDPAAAKAQWQPTAAGAVKLPSATITALPGKSCTPIKEGVLGMCHTIATSPGQTRSSNSTYRRKQSQEIVSFLAVTGNRDEFYMNCAPVTITGSGTSKLEDYDDMWVGDMNLPGRIKTGECRSKAGVALVYPNPGPFITIKEVSGIPFGPPTGGTCFVGPGKGKSTGSGSGDSGEGAGSGSGGSGSSSIVTKSESVVVSTSTPFTTTRIYKGKTTARGTAATTTTPLAGNGDGFGSGGDVLPTTTATATTHIAGGGRGGTKTTYPVNASMFPTTEEEVVPPLRSLTFPMTGTKTKTGAGHKSTSSSCAVGGDDGSDAGTGRGGSTTKGSGLGSGSGGGAGSGADNAAPDITQKPWTKIYTPTTFQKRFISAR